ncbi:hypothetical protein AB0J28_01910 [Streptosporangium canum]|uniref:hypothetical protein n=1 Tax=Streptosporangium canum TaxID=324952 RepID=UPI00341B384B
MATRHNLCINPACANDVLGWGGGSTPARTAVSGFARGFAARYTAGTFAAGGPTSLSAVTVGLTYTLSVYFRSTSNASGSIYVEWLNAGGSGFGYPFASYSGSAGAVTRASITAVAPTNAVGARVVMDGVNYGANLTDFTAVLIEQVAAVDVYFDGDSSGASWDGTAGNSSSTLTDSLVVAVTARGPLLLGGAAVARKAAPASGRGTVALSGAATARKAAPASGRGVLALTTAGTARKSLPAVGRAALALTALGTVRKAAPVSAVTPLGLTGTSVMRKRTLAVGASYLLLGGYHSQVTSRAVTGVSSLLLGGRGLAVKVAPAAGSAPMVLTGAAAARRISAASGVSAFVLAGNAAGQHRATAAGAAGLLMAGTGSVRRAAVVTGVGVLLLSAYRGDGPPPGPTRGQMAAGTRIGAVMRTRQRAGATMGGGR